MQISLKTGLSYISPRFFDQIILVLLPWWQERTKDIVFSCQGDVCLGIRNRFLQLILWSIFTAYFCSAKMLWKKIYLRIIVHSTIQFSCFIIFATLNYFLLSFFLSQGPFTVCQQKLCLERYENRMRFRSQFSLELKILSFYIMMQITQYH